MKIRLIPELNNKAIDAARICYKHHRPYLHNGKSYFITSLKPVGSGKDARLEAELKPVFGH